jgi:hypothetical protein
MEKIQCKCGKASMIYTVVGEDEWNAIAINTRIVNEGYGKVCICKDCRHSYDNFDPCMVTKVEIKHIEK